jgi:nickel-dependent lactate racemase
LSLGQAVGHAKIESSMVSLPFGEGALSVEVTGDIIRHRNVPVAADEQDAVREAIDNPISSPRLGEIVRPGEEVALIVNDITRLTRSDLMLPPLISALNAAGIPDRDILVVFALGIHRAQTQAERRRILGGELFSRLRSVDHDAFDETNLVEAGRTSFGNTVHINRQVWEADRIILTGEIIYHLIAGYSGGRKSLIPGVAGARTTTFNHNMIFDPRCRSGVLDGNPAHEDLMEACRMVEPDFLLNVVLSPEGRLVKAVAGHFDLAHRVGCRVVDEMLAAGVDEPYDLLIASAGGFPLDIDLRQAHKGLDNAVHALKPGGSIVFYAECAGGSGHPSIDEYAFRYDGDGEMREALDRKFEIGGHKAWWLARLGRMFDIHLVSMLPAEFLRRFRFRKVAPEQHQTCAEEQFNRAGPGARVGIIPYAGFTLPRVLTRETAGLARES